VNRIICGVDVSKDWLDAHVWPGGAAARFANDAAGIAALWLFCRSHGAVLAGMEASGGYERLGFMLLWAHGMHAVRRGQCQERAPFRRGDRAILRKPTASTPLSSPIMA
jgi:transposase